MSFASGLYTGTVMHKRLRPRAHRLDYRVFWLLLDLDEIERLDSSTRLFSRNRFNLFSFHDADYGAPDRGTLRAQVEDHLARAGLDIEGGAIRLLTMPRILGYVFNPISVYFCHQRGGELAAILYEVTNTFGQRHSYLIPVDPASASARQAIRQSARKALYVSPFIGMGLTYDFRVMEPGEVVSLVVRGSDEEGMLISASMVGTRREIDDAALARVAATHPLLTLKVVGAIHWEALKLWVKGVRLVPRPAAPDWPVTIVETKAR